MNRTILTTEIRSEQDVVGARQRAKQVAAALGFELQDQTRIATAVSEIARNAYRYARGGRVEFTVVESPARMLTIAVTDAGPGVKDLQSVLEGTYCSETGMGLGARSVTVDTDRLYALARIEPSGHAPPPVTFIWGKSVPGMNLPTSVWPASW